MFFIISILYHLSAVLTICIERALRVTIIQVDPIEAAMGLTAEESRQATQKLQDKLAELTQEVGLLSGTSFAASPLRLRAFCDLVICKGSLDSQDEARALRGECRSLQAQLTNPSNRRFLLDFTATI